jgi:outer membrane protein assembly factor BamA
MVPRGCLRSVLCITLLAGFVLPLSAQEAPPDTTADQNDQQQTERIVDGRPRLYFLERAMHPVTWIEAGVRPIIRSAESGRLHKLATRPRDDTKISGVKLGFGGMGPGSGLGPRITLFHKNLFARGVDVEVPLLVTYRGYEDYRFKVSAPLISDGAADRVNFEIGSGYSSRRGDDFYGIGNDSSVDDRSRFRTVTRDATVGLSAKFDHEWKSGFHLGYRNVGVTDPVGAANAQDVFRNAGIAGLFTGASLRTVALSMERDTTDEKRLESEGGRERVEVSLNEGIGKGDFSYWKYRFDFEHYFPLSRDSRTVVLVRGLAETNQEKGGSQIPFFDLPSLGDWDTLRGFSNYRFRDKSALALGVEYRYRIWQALDWGLFLDEAQVAPEPGDFGIKRFHTGYGARLIVFPKSDRLFSFDVGHSKEGWRVYFNFNP